MGNNPLSSGARGAPPVMSGRGGLPPAPSQTFSQASSPVSSPAPQAQARTHSLSALPAVSLSVPSLLPARGPSPSVPTAQSTSALPGTNVVTIASAASVAKSDGQLTEAEVNLRQVRRFVSLERANLYQLQLSAAPVLETCRIYQCHIRATAQLFCTNQAHLRNWMRHSSDQASKHVALLGNHFSAMRKFGSQLTAIELLEKQVVQIKKNVVDVVRMATRLNNLLPPQDRLPTLYLVDMRSLQPMGASPLNRS